MLDLEMKGMLVFELSRVRSMKVWFGPIEEMVMSSALL